MNPKALLLTFALAFLLSPICAYAQTVDAGVDRVGYFNGSDGTSKAIYMPQWKRGADPMVIRFTTGLDGYASSTVVCMPTDVVSGFTVVDVDDDWVGEAPAGEVNVAAMGAYAYSDSISVMPQWDIDVAGIDELPETVQCNPGEIRSELPPLSETRVWYMLYVYLRPARQTIMR